MRRWEAADQPDPTSTQEWRKEKAAQREWERRKARLLKRIARLLPHLPDLERQAVELHYGLADGRSRSLAEIGKTLGETEGRARQLVEDGLKKQRDLAGGTNQGKE